MTVQSITQASGRLMSLLITLCLLVMGIMTQAQTIRYVKQDGSGSGNGLSWTNASGDLQAMINATAVGDEIWVAEGTYLPTRPANNLDDVASANRNNAFTFVKNIKVYGGFPATGNPDMATRDWEAHPSILSGDLAGDDIPGNLETNRADNSYHVVITAGAAVGNDFLLDGFTVTGGNANGSNISAVNGQFILGGEGGGMYIDQSSPSIANSTFSGNLTTGGGGGMASKNDSHPIIIKSIFYGNKANQGGGMYNNLSSPTIANATFSGNAATISGGGMFSAYSSPIITNSTFSGNEATSNGGGMFNNQSHPITSNSTFSGNKANLGGGMYSYNESSPVIINSTFSGNLSNNGSVISHTDPITLRNSIVYGNSGGIAGDGAAIYYSLVQGMAPNPGTGMLDGNAVHNVFIDALAPGLSTGGDYRLLAGSPAIDAGSNAVYAPAVGTSPENDVDLAGNPRLHNNTIDLGAYEFQPPPEITPGAGNVLYVDIANKHVLNHTSTGDSWANAITELSDAMKWAEANASTWTETAPLQIWVAAGEYQPAADESFEMVDHVRIYGGFFGDEDQLNLRDWNQHKTILRGNGSSVVRNPEGLTLSRGAVLDGFTITGGNNGEGGGIYNRGDATFANLIITGNTATGSGGGIRNFASPLFYNILITKNTSPVGAGYFNTTHEDEPSQPRLINVTSSGNEGDTGPELHLEAGTPTIRNSIFYGNGTMVVSGEQYDIQNSLVQNATVNENGNVPGTTNPLFVDAANGDFSLRPASAAINGGSNQAYIDHVGPLANQKDLTGAARAQQGTIDMGALESPGTRILIPEQPGNILHVNYNLNQEAIGYTGDGSTWDNAVPDLWDALNWAKTNAGDWTAADPLQIWVAKGGYRPAAGLSFEMVDHVKIYGGFDGTETTLAARNYIENNTNLIGNGNAVIRNPEELPLSRNALLDGFSIVEGSALQGAGIYNAGDATFANLQIGQNKAGTAGGGIYNSGSPLLYNLALSGNEAPTGAGFYNAAATSAPTFLNVSIVGNYAYYDINGNNGDNGHEFYLEAGHPVIRNSIFYGNEVIGLTDANDIQYSLIKGRMDTDNGNVKDDNFFDLMGALIPYQFFMYPITPTVNGGNNQAYIDLVGSLDDDLDISGTPRLQQGVIDMGALESPFKKALMPDANNIVYINKSVDQTAPGYRADGSSWANAVPELADALSWARLKSLFDIILSGGNPENASWSESNPLKMYVAKGTYMPMYNAREEGFIDDAGPENAFVMLANVQLYGGFAGDETELDERDWSANLTILSGDLDNSGTPTNDDAHHVLISSGPVGTARLDGFTVSRGNANGGGSIIVNGETVSIENGGGLYNIQSSPSISNVTFADNKASGSGGGMYNNNSSPTITNVTFAGNSADDDGGGINNANSSPIITNVTVSGNSAGDDGGGIRNANSFPTLTNVTIAGNSAANGGGGMYNSNNSSPTLTNTIVWGNAAGNGSPSIENSGVPAPTISFSLVQGLAGGTNGNIDGTDPNLTPDAVFVAPQPPGLSTGGDYQLLEGSPGIDLGSNAAYEALEGSDIVNDIDLAGNPRLNSSSIDMGAYEFQGNPVIMNDGILYVDSDAAPGGDGSSWAKALQSFATAISGGKIINEKATTSADSLRQIWVANGTYQAESGTSFFMLPNVKIYGSFAGTESSLAERPPIDGAQGLSVLEGNGNSVIRNDNNGLDTSAVLDGFKITGGNATGINESGGGIYNNQASPLLSHLIISDNTADMGGGAIHNVQSSPIVSNSTIANNTSSYSGGGIANSSSAPVLINVAIIGNKAEIGGGIYNFKSNYKLINLTISNNTAVGSGGGIYNQNSKIVLTNSILWGNSGQNNGNEAIDVSISASSIKFNYSIYGNGDGDIAVRPAFISETNSLNISPQFVDSVAGDFRLTAISPAINTGNNDVLPNAALDLDNNPRIYNLAGNGIVDMGAYEFQGEREFIITPSVGNILYVDIAKKDAVGHTATGDSWANAVPELADALKWARTKWGTDGSGAGWAADNPLHIYVAKGTYLPLYYAADDEYTADGGSDNAFVMMPHTLLYGGFAGDETALDERDWRTNITMLSGDLDNSGTSTNNDAYHVLISAGPVGTARLDGFTVTGGNARGSSQGIDVNGEHIPRFTGGGMINHKSSPSISNTTFTGNFSLANGGGMNNNDSSPTITNTVFSGNSATSSFGGAMNNQDSSPTITNSLFSGNSAAEGGGAMYNSYQSVPIITNSTFSGNAAPEGGGIYYVGSIGLHNSIIYGNSSGMRGTGATVTHSLIQGISGSMDGNLDGAILNLDLFVDAPDHTGAPFTTGDYRLQPGSLAINAGNNGVFGPGSLPNLSEITTDLAGNPRMQRRMVDLGAFESTYALISELGSIQPITVPYGTPLTAVPVPDPFTVEATLNGGTSEPISLTQDLSQWTVTTPVGGVYDGYMAGTYTLEMEIADNEANQNPSRLRATVDVIVEKATPTITWDNPAAITYGTILSDDQLDATADVDGTFVYDPVAGTVLEAGENTLTVIFTPDDEANYETVTAEVTLTVNKATPTITWATPAPITYGTALSPTQLNATADLNGTFTYDPAVGAELPAGDHTLEVTFTPTDDANYNTAEKTVTLTVSDKIVPVITWNNPSDIIYGTTLSATQLNASADVDGTFTYDPAVGAELPAGDHTLEVTFRPTDANYATVSKEVTLTVNKAQATITADALQSYTYDGTAKNAMASLNHGEATLTYDPQQGYTEAGSYAVTISAAETTNYNSASKQVALGIAKAAWTGPEPTFPSIDPIVYDGEEHEISVDNVPLGSDVTYAIINGDGNEIPGNSITDAGDYTVIAVIRQDNHEDITVSTPVTIAKAQAIITADALQTQTYDGTAKNVAATLNHTETAPVYSPQQGYTDAGNYLIMVTAAETANYFGADARTVTLLIERAVWDGPAITLPHPPEFTYDGKPHPVTAVSLPPGATAEYTVTDAGGNTIPGNTVTGVGEYTVTVTVKQDNYRDAVATTTVTVRPGTRTIGFPALPEKTFGDGDFDTGATASSSEEVTYTSSNATVATIVAGRIHIEGAGTANITATLPENGNYANRPSAIQTLVVRKAPQAIDFHAPATVNRDAGSITLDASADSGLPISLTLDDPEVATLEGNTLHIHRLGTVQITASQAGDANHEAAEPVTVAIRVVDPTAELPMRVSKVVSPNGDGINEFLLIEGIKDHPDNKVTIFNRNGTVLYEAKGYNNGSIAFRGISTGQLPLPAGTYFYVAEIKINGTWKYEKGWFVLRY